MKLIMVLLVRDEIDIIAANIDFHLGQGVDFVLAIDNGSIDGTRDILDDYERAGYVRVFDEPGRDYAQAKWVTRAMECARDDLGADWIFSNDADEFWVPHEGNLREMLEGSNAPLFSARRLNMVYPWDDPGDGPWHRQITCRVTRTVPRPPITNIYTDKLPCPYFYLELPPKVIMQTQGLVSIAQGNHSATYDAPVKSIPAPLDIFHYPIRSREHFKKKIIQGGQAYAANTELPEIFGWHWRRWYRAYQEHGLEAPLADALPSKAMLDEGLQTGEAMTDRRFVGFLATTCRSSMI